MVRFLLITILSIDLSWGVQVHGNWCGPYHPGNAIMAKDQVPYPINFTDMSCRLHDFIYVNYDDDTRPDQLNPWHKIYPFEKQLEVDRLLVRDIQWGLTHSRSWGCEQTQNTEQRDDFSFLCKTPRLTLSDCKRERPNLYERLMARVVQIGMLIKIGAGFYLGSDKPGFSYCKLDGKDQSASTQANLLSFARPMVFMEETPSFCEVQADFSEHASTLGEDEIAEHLKVAFRYFEGRGDKIEALKKMNDMIRTCEIEGESEQGFFKGSISVISQRVASKALQLALEEDYRLRDRH